jgi:hypothetical protein
MQAHTDHHGPTCFPTSVVDLDLVRSGTFRPGRIQVRIRYCLTRLDPSSDPVLYDQVESKSGSRIIVSDPNPPTANSKLLITSSQPFSALSWPSLSSIQRPVSHLSLWLNFSKQLTKSSKSFSGRGQPSLY